MGQGNSASPGTPAVLLGSLLGADTMCAHEVESCYVTPCGLEGSPFQESRLTTLPYLHLGFVLTELSRG